MKQKPRLRRTIIAVLTALGSTLGGALGSGLPMQPALAFWGPSVNHPERQWQEINTPHFKIHYYQGFEDLAKLSARIAEEGFETITQDLGVAPDEKISLIISEDEFWNGYAEPARNRIVLDPRFSLEAPIGINRFLLHEMTHIFNFLAVQKKVFGSNLIKASGLPAWFAEGLAQYEAEYWAPENDRMLRLHLLNNSLLSPAERNAFTALSGKGSEGYNEGYALVKFMFETYGRDKLPLLLDNYRDMSADFYQAIAFTFGKSLLEIEAEWRQALAERTREQVSSHQENIPSATALIPYSPNRTYFQPKPSPNGKWLAYQTSGGYPLVRGQIYPVQPLMIADLQQIQAYGTQETKRREEEKNKDKPAPVKATPPPDLKEPGLHFKHGEHQPEFAANEKIELDKIQEKVVERSQDYAWAPDSSQLAYTLLVPDAYGNSTKSVEILKLKEQDGKLKADGSPERLLPGQTVHSPAWSPDGSRIALVLEEKQRDAIVIYNRAEQKIERTLLQAPDFRQYQGLNWSPDGRSLVAEVYLPGEGQSLMLLDPQGQQAPKLLTESSSLYADKQAIWSPDSQFVYFVSTRNGFTNLYRHQLNTGKSEALSDVYTGLEIPSLSADGKNLWYIRHHAQGTTLEQVSAAKIVPAPALAEELGDSLLTQNDLNLTPLGESSEPKNYEPWIAPEVFVPVVGLDEKGDQLGFLMQTGDLLQLHNFNVLFLYGLASSRISYNTAYVNRFFDTSFSVEVGDSPLLSFATDGSAYFITRDQQISLAVSRPLFNPGTGDTSATRVRRFASLEFVASHQTNLRSELAGLIDDKLLRQGWNNSLNLTWAANESVRNNDGIRYNVNLSAGGPWLGSQYSFAAANANFRHYIPVFGDHTLAYRVDATAMTGETRPALLGGPPLSNLLVLNFQNIIPLRGFRIAELQGSMMTAASLEYRFPLLKELNFNIGGHYLENLSAAAFVDAGDAWFPNKRTIYPHIAAGFELRSEAVLNYRNSFSLYLGVGKALLGHKLGADEKTYEVFGPAERGPEIYGGFINVF
jgi:Tol biopolymer transport system component